MNVLQKLRIKADLSQTKLAAMLGTTQPMVSNWESGARKPNQVNLETLAQIFDVDIYELRTIARSPVRKNTHLPIGVVRHRKRFRKRFKVNNQWRWQALKATTPEECWLEVAEQKTGKQKKQQPKPLVAQPKIDTIAHAIDRYINVKVPELLKSGQMKDSTWRTEKHRALACREVLKDCAFEDLTVQMVYAWGDEANAWRKIKRLSAMWKYFMRWGYTQTDLFNKFEYPRNYSKARTRYVTDAELQKACEVCQNIGTLASLRVWALMRLIALTGRRVTDIRTLTMRQLQDDGIHFDKENAESKTQKKTIIEWNQDLRDTIKAIKAGLHSKLAAAPYGVVCDNRGQIMTAHVQAQAFVRMQREFRKAGIEYFQLRDLRAKFGTDHDDGRTALRHSSQKTFDAHYDRKPAVVQPLTLNKSNVKTLRPKKP